jgi:hypothetical protein
VGEYSVVRNIVALKTGSLIIPENPVNREVQHAKIEPGVFATKPHTQGGRHWDKWRYTDPNEMQTRDLAIVKAKL